MGSQTYLLTLINMRNGKIHTFFSCNPNLQNIHLFSTTLGGKLEHY